MGTDTYHGQSGIMAAIIDLTAAAPAFTTVTVPLIVTLAAFFVFFAAFADWTAACFAAFAAFSARFFCFMACCACVPALEEDSSSSPQPLSKEVLSYTSVIRKYAGKYGIPAISAFATVTSWLFPNRPSKGFPAE